MDGIINEEEEPRRASPVEEPSLLARQRSGEESKESDPNTSMLSKEVLTRIARLHFHAKNERLPTGSVLEARSTLSSPGKINFTLREKLGRMSRGQRKDLLTPSATAGKPLMNDASSNSILVDESGENSVNRSIPPPPKPLIRSKSGALSDHSSDNLGLRTRRQAQKNHRRPDQRYGTHRHSSDFNNVSTVW